MDPDAKLWVDTKGFKQVWLIVFYSNNKSIADLFSCNVTLKYAC
jgi:hypothetical protein